MKRLLFATVLILGLCLPAWGTEYTWTDTGGDEAWDTVTNWNPEAPAGGPVAGDTLTFDAAEGANGSNLPTTGPAVAGAFNISISGYTATKSLTDFIPGTSSTVITSLTDATLSITFDLTCTLPATVSLLDVVFDTAGTVTCNASGTTVTAAGNALYTAGTISGSLNLTMTGTGKTLSWAVDETPPVTAILNILTITGSVTIPDFASCRKFAGTGSLDMNGLGFLLILATANDCWSGSVAFSNDGVVEFCTLTTETGDFTQSNDVDVGSAKVWLLGYNGNVFTFNGDFSTTGTVQVGSCTVDTQQNFIVNGNLSCGAITFGAGLGGGDFGPGGLTLGTSGTHVIGSVISASGCTGNALNIGGHITTSGDWTLKGIAVDFGKAAIFADADITINGDGATSIANTRADLFSNGTGKVLTVDYIGAVTGNPIRVWCNSVDGGHNTAGSVTFHPTAPDQEN